MAEKESVRPHDVDLFHEYLNDIRDAKRQQWSTMALVLGLIGFCIAENPDHPWVRLLMALACVTASVLGIIAIAGFAKDIAYYRKCKRYYRSHAPDEAKPDPSSRQDRSGFIVAILITAIAFGVVIALVALLGPHRLTLPHRP